MADISTPTTARKTEEFTLSQIDLVRTSLGIADFPYQPEKTYIIFDAASGDNDLHLDSGTSTSYSILKGDGSQPVDYTDTGGTKILNYTNAGRYLITIEGDFHGIDTSGAAQAAKDKYIGVIGGSNYPVIIEDNAFDSCEKLKKVIFNNATSIGDESFVNCEELMYAEIPNGSLGIDSFLNTDNLILLIVSSGTYIGSIKSDIIPETNNDSDLGSSSKQFKDIYIDGISYLDSISLDGDIIPETTDVLDLGSSSKKFDTLYINKISHPNESWSSLPVDVASGSSVVDSASIQYRLLLDQTVEFRGSIEFNSGAIGIKSSLGSWSTSNLLNGSDLIRKYALFEFSADTLSTTIRTKGWGRFRYDDATSTFGIEVDFTDVTSVSDNFSFYFRVPLD